MEALYVFKTDKQDEQFETNKAQVMKEIVALEPRDQSYDMREIGCCLERRGVASDIDEPYNLHLAYRVFYWLLTFYPKLQKSSVNLGPTWILITLKIQSNSSWLLKGLKMLTLELVRKPKLPLVRLSARLGAPIAFPRKVER
ncbi:hypothetical protein H0E87_002177 [Populus deltoides]|uniref:Uncharacterized protein n=1 Tax=Populus deltoides TaxID=3696 RepID=A0A8T2ZUG0_POPDE|nr:hypothetical protein H0E87_002177 [Populus deltoides]